MKTMQTPSTKGVAGLIIGLVIAIILLVAVAIPVTISTIAAVNFTGYTLTQTVVTLVPLMLAVLGIVFVAGAMGGKR